MAITLRQPNGKGGKNPVKRLTALSLPLFLQPVPSQSEGHIFMDFLTIVLLQYKSRPSHASYHIRLRQPPLGMCHHQQRHGAGEVMAPTC